MYKQHPLSCAFPEMQDDEFQVLCDSIESIGVQNPITLFEGMVIDGWHRYKAAKQVNIDCPSVLLGNVDPQDFVIAQNKARRNLTPSQRAIAVTTVYEWHSVGRPSNWTPVANKPKSAQQLADIAGVSVGTIKNTKVAQKAGFTEAVKDGAISVKQAAKIATGTAATPKPMPEIMPVTVTDGEDGAPDDAEMESVRLQEEAAQKTMQLLLASDEPMADLANKNTQLEAQIKQLNLRIAGLMNSNTEYIKTIKRLQAQLKKVQE